MPVYCYTREDTGELVELVMTVAQKAKRERTDKSIRRRDGVVLRRDIGAEHSRAPLVMPSGNWPQVSDALAVSPRQRREAHEHSVKIGVPTDYNRDGQPVWTDRAHKKRFGEATGFFDRDAGYGDAQPGSGKVAE